MSWLQKFAPSAKTGSPFDAEWYDDVAPALPAKPFPDDLSNIIFEPDDDALATFAILDAANVPNLAGLLAETGLQYDCLFQGKRAEELASAAPWLVELKRDNRFTKRLFSDGQSPWDLWKVDGIMLWRASLGFAQFRRHLRHFTRLQHDNGNWYYFRFWQADIMAALAMLGPFDLTRQIFAIEGVAKTIVPTDGSIVTLTPKDGIDRRRTVPVLDDATWDAMSKAVAFRFRHRLLQECIAQGEVPHSFADAVITHLEDWGFKGRNTIRDLALWWTTDSGAHMLNQSWAQAELSASRGMPDEVRADRLRNLADDIDRAGYERGTHATG